jgi:hypothetical protein
MSVAVESMSGTPFSQPAVTTWKIVNPLACATGVVPSAPRVTVHVTPDTLVTSTISDELAEAASTT